jgi:hypothetical protein
MKATLVGGQNRYQLRNIVLQRFVTINSKI